MPDDAQRPRFNPQPEPPASNWEWWHTAALLAIVALFVWMAVWRPWGIYRSWIVSMLALVAFVLVAGNGIRGVWRGALIDERNKISLSRLQMLTWTILALSAYGTIAIARTTTDPLSALDVAIPSAVWLLMGISTTSLVGSPLLKSTKKEPTLALKPEQQSELMQRQGMDPAAVRVDGQIVSNLDIENARWSDLFTGEEVANVRNLDLAKIQMFFFTVLLVLSYGVAIGSSLKGAEIPPALPDVGDGMLALLGISHTGYLVNKAVPSAKPE